MTCLSRSSLSLTFVRPFGSGLTPLEIPGTAKTGASAVLSTNHVPLLLLVWDAIHFRRGAGGRLSRLDRGGTQLTSDQERLLGSSVG